MMEADMTTTNNSSPLRGFRDVSEDKAALAEHYCPEIDDEMNELQRTLPTDETYDTASINSQRCHINSLEMYRHMHWRSLNDSENFWREMAYENLRWQHNFIKASCADFHNLRWFTNGKLNVCDNCVDRWAEVFPDRVALIWEPDDPNIDAPCFLTYQQLLEEVCKLANLLKYYGVRKGDIVSIYLPMIPEVTISMLACARLGAVHSVVFAGFSANSLAERLSDARSQILITANVGQRGGKTIYLKDISDKAMALVPHIVKTCIVFSRHKYDQISMLPERDIQGEEAMKQMKPYCPLEFVDSEDTLFLLYTSGSTGSPKGVQHSTAGYLLYSAMTLKYVFDVHPGDIFACVADIGWITGHSYVVYGPLCNGITTVIFESIPTYPNPGRYWELVDKLKATQFYTAPTSIRTLMKHGESWVEKYKLNSLRILGSVGEPLNPEAWRWYNKVVGRDRCNIVDTYWQTETGGHVLAPLPGAFRTKAGSVTLPFFGIDPVILDPRSGEELHGKDVHGVLCFRKPWPGMMRSVHGAHERFLYNYLLPYPSYYLTGDGAIRDKDGYYWITGRIDDTLNISGHRLGAAEVEHAFVQHPDVAEAAVVGVPHNVKGTCIFCFITLKSVASHKTDTDYLKQHVRSLIGPFATPDFILLTPHLPKTRSGKIVRRALRKIAVMDLAGIGDISTVADPSIIPNMIEQVTILREKAARLQ